jgi:hypothetical protein
MEKRFGVLRTFSLIWKVLAWFVLIVSLVTAIGAIFVGTMTTSNPILAIGTFGVPGGIVSGLIIAAMALLLGVVTFLFVYAFAQVFDVLLATEENTRAAASYLKPKPVEPKK